MIKHLSIDNMGRKIKFLGVFLGVAGVLALVLIAWRFSQNRELALPGQATSNVAAVASTSANLAARLLSLGAAVLSGQAQGDLSQKIDNGNLQEKRNYYYLAHWEWFTEADGSSYWRAPGGDSVGLVDLRSLPQAGIAGGTPQGYGFFAYNKVKTIPKSIFLGNDIDGLSNKDKIEKALGVTIPAGITTPPELLWELLVYHADPTGQSKWKPLRGTPAKGVKLVIADKVIQKPFDQKAKDNTIAVFQADYRRNKAEGMPLETLQRWTGSNMRDLKVGADDLLPQEYLSDSWKEPHTTITEAWDCANSDDPDCDLDWTEILGDWDIINNSEIRSQAGSFQWDKLKAEPTLSTDDHYTQALVTQADSNPGVITRYNSTNDDYYRAYHSMAIARNEIFEVVAGVATSLGWHVQAYSVPFTLRLESDGTTHTFYVNGTQEKQSTGTNVSGNFNTGLTAGRNTYNTQTFDNFEAGDLWIIDIQGVDMQGINID